MDIDNRALMEVLGPIIAMLFLTVTLMFCAVPYALERHPFDDSPRQAAVLGTYHLT